MSFIKHKRVYYYISCVLYKVYVSHNRITFWFFLINIQRDIHKKTGFWHLFTIVCISTIIILSRNSHFSHYALLLTFPLFHVYPMCVFPWIAKIFDLTWLVFILLCNREHRRHHHRTYNKKSSRPKIMTALFQTL